MSGAANAVDPEPGLGRKDVDTDRKSNVIRWSHHTWRLRGITRRLHVVIIQSIALRTAIRHGRFEREYARLEQLRRILIADGTLSRQDPDATRRLAIRVAAFYQQVGVFERAVESVFEELSELTDNAAVRA